jgi:ribosomal protein S18 acetylase RimI-like enzyme
VFLDLRRYEECSEVRCGTLGPEFVVVGPATAALVVDLTAELDGHSGARLPRIGAFVEPDRRLDDEWVALEIHQPKASHDDEALVDTHRVAPMDVREGLAEDAPAIAEVFIASFKSLDFLPTLHTDEEHRAFIRDLVVRGDVWIAAEDGRIVGMAALAGDVLRQLYIHPDAQGRGAGSALLDKVKELRSAGFTFWVFQQNTRARRFYESHGCRVVRLTDGSDNDENTPDALYEWRPASGAN